jgi:hypothetical protein
MDCRYGNCRYALAVDDYVINEAWNLWNNIFSNNLWFNSQKENQAIAIIKRSEQEHFQFPVGGIKFSDWENKNGVSSEKNWNPLFLDVSRANFHIKEGSPAIDNWQNISVFNDDFEWTQRPGWAYWDIWAYEYYRN